MTPFSQTGSRRLVQNYKSSARWLQILLDQIVVVGLLAFHTWLKTDEFGASYRLLAVITVLLMAVVYQSNQVYGFYVSITDRFLILLRSWAIVVGLLILLGFATKSSASYSREVILTWSATALFGQALAFLLVSGLQSRTRERAAPALMVGAGDLAKHLTTHINANKWISDQVVGVVSSNEEKRAAWNIPNVPLLGTLDDIRSIVLEQGIKRVYIALPLEFAAQVEPIYRSIADDSIDVIWAPDIFAVNLLNHSIREVAGVPLITLAESPLIGSSAFLKSLLDYSIAIVAVLLLSPVLLITACLVKLTSPGPVFFRQERHGWDGQIFTVFKFRSMRVHKEEAGKVTQATKDDNRVTSIGRFLRKSSLDELPQLFNVLNGTMSLVGPRPHAVAHNQFYSERIKAYMLRHRVKPGLTGLAQVNGYRGETQTIEAMENRVQFDLAYINSWSIWLDIKIMFRTVFVLIGDNVY